MEKIIIHPSFSNLSWLHEGIFLSVADILSFSEGTCYKQNRYRSVRRFEKDGNFYFLKQFHHVPLSKQIRNILFSRHSEAFLEWNHLDLVKNLNIPTLDPVAWGEDFRWRLEKGGFLITKESPATIRVESFLKSLSPAQNKWREKIVDTIADYTRCLHENSYFHKDLYLGHFLIDPRSEDDFDIYLIDLQRLQKHRILAEHYRIKDLASLYFSVPENSLSRTFQLRFLKKYLKVKRLTKQHKKWITRILKKSGKIARHTIKLLRKRNTSP
ncbi:MAG: hypothetical protein JW774_10810 [Candidatus Aureabacteria bacterium]|nr:hypothetical protein [Candidatus Auribacterota bacterium]